jgi:hypothetical protein
MIISIVLALALGASIAVQSKINTTLANRLAVTALKGDKGDSGKDGVDGAPGKAGKAGKDGVDGKDGANGAAGANGTNGINGVDGKDGVDGVCTVDPEKHKETLRVLAEYLIQAFPPAGEDPRIHEILNR